MSFPAGSKRWRESNGLGTAGYYRSWVRLYYCLSCFQLVYVRYVLCCRSLGWDAGMLNRCNAGNTVGVGSGMDGRTGQRGAWADRSNAGSR